jgi:hypothetical protein
MGKSESRFLRTTEDVLNALGGYPGMIGLTRRPYKRVWDWVEGGQFPSKYHALMTFELSKRRLRARPSLWGQVTTPELDKAAA